MDNGKLAVVDGIVRLLVPGVGGWGAGDNVAIHLTANVGPWICFHCGEEFTSFGAAADHFGADQSRRAGCLVDRVALEEGGKSQRGRGLLMALREVEDERDNERFRAQHAVKLLDAAGIPFDSVPQGTPGHIPADG